MLRRMCMVDNEIPLISAQKTQQKDVSLDPAGFFVIELNHSKKTIRVEYYKNVYKNNKIVSGKLSLVFEGNRADALCDTISEHIKNLLPEHYLYLGRELQRAVDALTNKKSYVQDGC